MWRLDMKEMQIGGKAPTSLRLFDDDEVYWVTQDEKLYIPLPKDTNFLPFFKIIQGNKKKSDSIKVFLLTILFYTMSVLTNETSFRI